MPLNIRSISSSSRDVCTDDVLNALNHILSTTLMSDRADDGSSSPPVDIIVTEGTGGYGGYSLTDGNGHWGAFTTPPYGDGHIAIVIPAELLKTGDYIDGSGNRHPETLERILIHEVTHVWQTYNEADIETNDPDYDPNTAATYEGYPLMDSHGHRWDDYNYHPESAMASENHVMGSKYYEPDAHYGLSPGTSGDPYGDGGIHYGRGGGAEGTDGKVYTYDDSGNLITLDCKHEPPAPWVPAGVGLIGSGEATGSPLVMDLSSGGTGLSLSSHTSDPVYWDIGIEGVRHASGWISDDTGLLCIDLNSNGTIDDNGELFGDEPASGIADGFQALAVYDSNSDGAITSSDTQFGDLRVWVDSNHDGLSDSGELHTLASLSITNISLTYSNVNYSINGNVIKEEGTFTIGGNTHTIADAWFTYDPANTIANTEYLDGYTLNDDVAVLPNQRGYGLMPDLHFAMSNDSTLLSMVEDVAGQTLSDLFDPTYDVGSKMLAIAYQWAGVESVSPTSRGGYFDGQKLEFLEHLFDFTYWGAVGSNPGPNSQTYLDEAWPLVFGAISANILGQTALGDLFGHPGYSVADDVLSGGTWNSNTAIQFASLGVGIGVGSILHDTGMNDIYVFQAGDSPISGSYYELDESVNSDTNILLLGGVDPTDVKMWDDSSGNLWIKYSTTDQVEILGSHATGGENEGWKHIQEIAFSNDGTIWDLTNGLNLTALNNSQVLYGTTYADTLTSANTYSILYGYDGDDTLVADSGSALHGGDGNDTYVFSAGAASTTYGGAHIYESSGEGTDTVAFHGITPANVQMWTNSSGELIIQYASGDQAIVEGGSYSGSTGFTVGYVEQATFDTGGGSTWDLTGGLHLVNDNTGRSFFGTAYGDIMEGGTGDDSIYAYAGADSLYGGGGNDFLQGGAGADTYILKAATAFGGSFATISGFSTGDSDVIDMRDVLSGHYNPGTDNINDFVSFSTFFGSTLIYIDQDGTGGSYSSTMVGELYSVTGVTVSGLISNSELLVS